MQKSAGFKSHSNLWQRIATGVPLALGAAALVWVGSFWFTLLVAVAVFFAQSEFEHFLRLKGVEPQSYLVLLGALAMLAAAHFGNYQYLTAIFLLALVLAALGAVIRFGHRPEPLLDSAGTWLALGYCGWLPAHIVLLRQVQNSAYHQPSACCWGDLGLGLVGLVVLMCVATDVGAFAFGKLLGKHKLCPKVSPGKTIEGAVGGVAVALLLSWGWSAWSGLALQHCLILAAVGSVIAQFGDLFESSLKRNVGVKDSGNLIAGHGGALDRLDSFLLVIPWVYLYLQFFMK